MKSLLFVSICLATFGLTIGAATQTQAAEGVTWKPLYEPGCGGWITSVRISPHDPNRILIGGDMLGIGLSTDRGDSWTPARGLPSYEIGDFTWHPTEPMTVWAGTMSGPVLSTDGGATWASRRDGFPPVQGGTYGSPVERVLFDPNDTNRLVTVGGSSRGWEAPKGAQWGQVYESHDSGKSWKLVGQLTDEKGEGQNIRSMAFAAKSSTTLYAGGISFGVRVSTDGGKTWVDRSEGLPSRSVERVIAHPTKPDTLWVCTGTGPGADELRVPGGVYRSDDAGKTWQPLVNGLSQARARDGNMTANYKGFDVSPSNPDHMVVSDGSWNRGGVYVSTDGGQHWRLAATRSNLGHEKDTPNDPAFAPKTAYFSGIAQTVASFDPKNPSVIFTAGSEFALRTRDGGKTWDDSTALMPNPANDKAWRGRGYSGLCSIWFAFHPTDKGRAFLLAMDAGKLWQSRDNMKSWTYHGHEPWPWGGGNDVAFAGKTIYATYGQHGSFHGIGVSRDDGKTFKVLSGAERGLPKDSTRGEAKGIYARASNPAQAWASVGDKLLYTDDSGEHWKPVEGLTGKAFFIAGDPKKPDRFFVTGEKNIWLTEDAGKTFTNIGGPRSTWRSRLTVDTKGRLLVASWRDGKTAGLWRYDSGNWTRLLDESHAFCPSVDATDPTRIALSTSDDPFHDFTNATGVWISVDDGKTWTNASDGLGMLRGQVVAINPHDPEQLVFGSFGGGYYEGRWPKSYRPVGTRSYTSTAADATNVAPQAAEVHAAPPKASDPSSDPKSVSLKNGSFELGSDAVQDWESTGTAQLSRDTKVFKQGTASLKISVDGDGQGLQYLPLSAGTKLRVKGQFKSEGAVKVNAFVMSFDEKGAFVKFDQLRYTQNDSDWQTFDREVTLPPTTARCAIGVMAQGKGSAWLDDVTVQIDGKDASVNAQPAAPTNSASPANTPAEAWKKEPAKGAPNTPAWGFYPEFPAAWMGHFESQVARSTKGNADVVFIGDSLTQDWGGTGKDVWAAKFAPLNAVNYGIGGDSTRQVLYRLDNGLLEGLRPKVIVLMIGTNNLYDNFNAGSDEEIAAGIRACVEKIRSKSPGAKVLVLSLLPRQNDYFNSRIDRINATVAKLDDGSTVKYVYVRAPFEAEKPVKKELYAGDQLHLAKKGYEALADQILPTLDQLLKD